MRETSHTFFFLLLVPCLLVGCSQDSPDPPPLRAGDAAPWIEEAIAAKGNLVVNLWATW